MFQLNGRCVMAFLSLLASSCPLFPTVKLLTGKFLGSPHGTIHERHSVANVTRSITQGADGTSFLLHLVGIAVK
jgi:hypothetical protein